MKRLLLHCLFALIAVSTLVACGGGGDSTVSTFSKSYGGPLHDEARVVLDTEDGGFMLLGTAEGNELLSASSFQRGIGSPSGGDFWVQKLDANGNVEHNRLIGSHSLPGDTTWQRARPTPDGGVVLTGSRAQTQVVTRSDGTFGPVTIARDFAITKLDAVGAVVWSVTYDSGAWQNYNYFAAGGTLAEAWDIGLDVWPTADGGYLVAGISTANLEDRLGIGFACADAELDVLAAREAHSPCQDPSPHAGNRFMEAFSIVVLRLNADGSQRWQRRLTDNAFDSNGNRTVRDFQLGLLVRGTADGGVVLARPVDGGTLVHRLGADGAPRWRAALGGSREANPLPRGLIQTDDPVDGPNRDLQDGQIDDGFALAVDNVVFKLTADGAIEWSTVLGGDNAVILNDLLQSCDYGRPIVCDIVAVGSTNKPVDIPLEPLAPFTGFHGVAFFLDTGGGVRSEAFKTASVDRDPPVAALTRIAAGAGRTLELLGLDRHDNLMRLNLAVPAPGDETLLANLRSGTEHVLGNESPNRPLPELRPDGGIALLTESGGTLKAFDAQVRLQSGLDLAPAAQSEVLRAAAKIGPGRYLLAGTRRAPGGQSGIVALRYDLNADGSRVVWQRQLIADEFGDVLAAVASGDGGAVLSLVTTIPVAAENLTSVGRLLKLDGDGRLQWQSALPGPAIQLERMADGGFAVLSSGGQDSVVRVTRLSATGQRLWQRSVLLGAQPGQERGRIQALAATADGGLVLAGGTGFTIELARLDADGTLLSARSVTPSAGANAFFDDMHIRQAADGSFVLAMTEKGLFTTMPDGNGDVLPYGQGNVFVLGVDAEFRPLWGHVYGARFDEGVRSLSLRADGTIAVAGFSDSLGERREAWLLKLSAEGLISAVGCQALLGSIAVAQLTLGVGAATVASSDTAEPPLAELPPFVDTDAPVTTPQDHVTARQCLGDAGTGSGSGSGSGPVAPGATARLSVLQVGTQHGVVTSTPGGISCGTGLDICAADFAQGSRIGLRADRDRFIAWRGDCDEGTGGTQLDCVIVLNRDRTIQVEFGVEPAPPPPMRFTLSFAVQGLGLVQADGGINCGEGGAAAACSRDYDAGALVNVNAVAFPGQVFLGWSGDAGDTVCPSLGHATNVRITMDRHLRCFAQFGPVVERLLSISVIGAGVVRDAPEGAAINCREGGSQSDCREVYTPEAVVTLRAQPDAGQRFVGWGGDCASNGIAPSITLLMAQSFGCTATFFRIDAPSG